MQAKVMEDHHCVKRSFDKTTIMKIRTVSHSKVLHEGTADAINMR